MPRASHPPTNTHYATDRLPKSTSVELPTYIPLAIGAERLSLCERTLRRAISAGELQGFKFGKALRVRLDDLDRWAESKAMPNARTLSKAR